MIVRNLKGKEDLYKALVKTNKSFKGNIQFNRHPQAINQGGSSFRFTLKVIDSRSKGARLGFPSSGDYDKRRRMISACWHVHGTFFDCLFEIRPEAVITSRGKKITAEYGNWEDFDIGSLVQPYYMSEACKCDS